MERMDKIIVTFIVIILVVLIGCVTYNVATSFIKRLEIIETSQMRGSGCCECDEFQVMSKDCCTFKVNLTITYSPSFGNNESFHVTTNDVLCILARNACVKCAQNYTAFDLSEEGRKRAYGKEVYDMIVADAEEKGVEIVSVWLKIQSSREVCVSSGL